MSFVLTLMMVFAVLMGILAVGAYLVGEAIKKQAKKGRYFATLPQPGKFMFVIVGGKLDRIVENVVGWELNNGLFQHSLTGKESSGFWEETLGVTWIGLYGEVKVFEKWQWAEFRQKNDPQGIATTEYEVVARQADATEFLFQFTYSVPMKDIEFQGNDQGDGNAQVTVFVLDPQKAFLTNKNWINDFVGIVQSAIRNWAGSKTFDEVKTSSGGLGHRSEFSDVLLRINGIIIDDKTNPDYVTPPVPGGLFQILGIAIWNVTLQDLEASGPAAEARRQIVTNQLKGEADIAAAEKAAKVLVLQAQARMDAAERDAIAQRTLLESTVGFFSSLPGGDRMYVANQIASAESDVATWVESGSDVKVTIPLKDPPAKNQPPPRV